MMAIYNNIYQKKTLSQDEKNWFEVFNWIPESSGKLKTRKTKRRNNYNIKANQTEEDDLLTSKFDVIQQL